MAWPAFRLRYGLYSKARESRTVTLSSYLRGIRPLCAEHRAAITGVRDPAPRYRRAIREAIQQRKRAVRKAREAYERVHGPIEVEEPYRG